MSINPAQLGHLPSVIKEHISEFVSYNSKNLPKVALVSKDHYQTPVQHLDLSYKSITDDELIRITSEYKNSLVSINLKGCTRLTDKKFGPFITFYKTAIS